MNKLDILAIKVPETICPDFKVNDDNPVLIQDIKPYFALAPISAVTGFRTDYITAISVIDPKKSRLAESFISELIPVKSMPVDDDTKLDLIVSRLDKGSFAENDRAAEIIGNAVKHFLPKVSPDKVEKVVDNIVQQTEQAEESVEPEAAE